MNFALLGADAAARSLLAAIGADPAHNLSHVVLAGQFGAEVISQFPSARVSDAWDELITDASVEGVIVGGSDPAVLEGARQIASAGKPLIVFPCIQQGTQWYYELGLVRDDTHVPLIPLFVGRFSSRMTQMRQLIADGSIGKILQLQMERQIRVESATTGTALLSADRVEEMFFPDVDLLRSFGGNYSRVTSFQSGLVDERFSQAINTLSGDGLPESLWNIKGTQVAASWKFTVTGESGTLTLDGSDDEDDWRVARNGTDIALPGMESSVQQQLLHCVKALCRMPVTPDWGDLTRAADICDGARRSIKRRRTIDLHFESTSERSQFKTHMTAVGCSLLTLTLFGVIFVLIAGTLLDPREAAEIKADHAGAIFYVDDFVPREADLVAPDEERFEALASRMRGASFPVLIEGDPKSSSGLISHERRNAIVERLKTAGAADADQRVEIAALSGPRFQTLMLVARILVFVPLGLFLLLQLLLFVTRPAATASNRKDGEAPAEASAM